jgi:cation diffusion facilitator CzcD-associated flavoprotein CzcO
MRLIRSHFLHLFLLLMPLVCFEDVLEAGLEELEAQLKVELQNLDYPPISWRSASESVYDVVIIGSGMAGNAAAFALQQLGITNIQVYDAQPCGLEGPWLNYARMRSLRSGKTIMGPALGLSSLTFQAWFKAQFGDEAWEKMHKIPTGLWADYLYWYRQVLELPVAHNHQLKSIDATGNQILLTFDNGKRVITRKLVLATGRDGCGGIEVPALVKDIPKSYWAHTAEIIDFDRLKGKRLCIVGVGASSLDAAGVALEKGAAQVDLLMRRSHLPNMNKFADLSFLGSYHGFYLLPDQVKVRFLSYAFEQGIPAPIEALQRVDQFSNISLQADTALQAITVADGQLKVETNRGAALYDFIIFGTGFNVDVLKQPELQTIARQVLTWGNCLHDGCGTEKLSRFPYLGPHFQLIARSAEAASFLSNIYCFNYGALVSHGLISSDIMGISVGANRLAQGIAADLFVEDQEDYYREMVEDQSTIYSETDFRFTHQ